MSRSFSYSQDRIILVMIVCFIKLAYFTWSFTLPSMIIRNPLSFFPHNLINLYWIFKLLLTFPTSMVLSNFNSYYRNIVLLSNFGLSFPTSLFPISFRTFHLKSLQLLILSNCLFEQQISLSNFWLTHFKLSNFTFVSITHLYLTHLTQVLYSVYNIPYIIYYRYRIY